MPWSWSGARGVTTCSAPLGVERVPEGQEVEVVRPATVVEQEQARGRSVRGPLLVVHACSTAGSPAGACASDGERSRRAPRTAAVAAQIAPTTKARW